MDLQNLYRAADNHGDALKAIYAAGYNAGWSDASPAESEVPATESEAVPFPTLPAEGVNDD